MTYIDQLKREIQLNKIPKRIISLVPSQTELLVDLGLEASIVGVCIRNILECLRPLLEGQNKSILKK